MPSKPKEPEYRYDARGVPMCGCKRVKCRECKRRFSKEEYELTHCPDCGEERFCRNLRIKDPNTPNKWLPCKVHGGMSHKFRGAAHPRFKDGKYAKYMPKRLLDAYDQAREDPDILSLNEDIALTIARVSDVLQRVDAKETGEMWDDLSKTAKELKAARRSGDVELVEMLLENMLNLIAKGKGDRDNWREIGDLQERRRKLTESQLKLQVAKQDYISRQQAVAFVGSIMDVIKLHVSDSLTKRRIIGGIQQIMNLPEGKTLSDLNGLYTYQERPVAEESSIATLQDEV